MQHKLAVAIDHGSPQPLLYQPQQAGIGDQLANLQHQQGMVNAIKKIFNVGVHHPLVAPALQTLDAVYRLLDTAPFAVGKAAIFKLCFK